MDINVSGWTDIGNGARSAIVEDPEQPGNFKNLRVQRVERGRYTFAVNGAYRGARSKQDTAKAAAISFAKRELSDGLGVPLSTDPAKREEQVNTLARQELPRITVASLLADLEAALKASPSPARGADHANAQRVSAVWKIINGTKKRMV